MSRMSGVFTFVHTILVLLSLGCGFWCCGGASSDMAPMEKREQEALYSSIQGFVGDWWNGSDLYPDPCGWTPIQGVSCDLFDGLWYVTALSIGLVFDNSLDCATNAEFRPHLFKLKHLKSLSFSKCFISHPLAIPAQNWDNLAGSLESLQFRSNPSLIGQVPSTLSNLVNLESLVMLQNGLSGSLPPSLGNLTKLKKLVLAGNWFEGHIPESLGSLSELLILDLSRNHFLGELGVSIGDLGSLLKLDLSSNKLEGKVPENIGFLKKLTLLDLSKNNFSGGLAKAFQEMHSLEEMVLSGNPMGGDLDVIEWQKLQNLVILDLSNTMLNGEVPSSISDLGRLRFLGLSNNNLKGNVLEELANLPCISAMYLDGNNFSGKLTLTESFYSKMGRRFGVWNNPNLCYQKEYVDSRIVPFGVKPCVQDSVTKLGDHAASLGCFGLGIVGFWWILLVEVLVMGLMVSNCSL